jgi:thymidylate synthase (FAD)
MGERINVGSEGFVELRDVMGNDAAICEAARVSYDQGRKVSDDRTLIRYLMRHRHTTPFEMAEVKFHIRVPIDVWRQGARHRMASTNEYSQRYREAINAVDIPNDDQWRKQSTSNKQGSEGIFSSAAGGSFSLSVQYHTENARRIYECMLETGVAREQARRHLPLCTYTELIWKIDLHNLLHFLHLRMAPEAQQEIREYANAIHQLVFPLFPKTFDAFAHYRLHAMPLTALDIAAIQSSDWAGSMFTNDRERNEYLAKLQRLELPKGE